MERDIENKMKRIFIIEDDQLLRVELAKMLEAYGYTCQVSDEFERIIEVALSARADLILLDINLPYYDGHHICREIRKQSDVPIIVVTSSSSDMDELMSMNLGADDFVTKPYNKQILLARIGAVLKRAQAKGEIEQIEHKGVILYPAKSIVAYEGVQVELTKNELRILSILMHHRGEIVSRDEIMEELWQSEEFVDDNTLTVNVNRLRKKLDEIGAVSFVQTKRGQGYMI